MITRRKSRVGAALALVGVFAVSLAGCPGNQAEKSTQPASSPPPSITLRVRVLNDADLIAVLKLLRGEWSELRGGDFTVEGVDKPALLEEGDADLFVFPPLLLGQLCEEQRLRPVRDSVLRDEGFRYTDIYPVVRERLLGYGGQIMALPIGCAAPVLVQNIEDESRRIESWQDDPTSPAAAVSNHSEAFNHTWLLLARALTYCDGDASSVLFDPQTMAARITSPEFVRALHDVRVALAGHGQGKSDAGESGGLSRTFLTRGQPDLVVWPLRPSDGLSVPRAEGASVSLLPGSAERYDSVLEEWRKYKEVRRVTMLGTSGRLVAVTADSTNAAEAFRLSAWLAGPQNGRQLSFASSSTAAVRRSLGRLPDDWTGLGDRELGRQFSVALGEAFSLPDQFAFPRILQAEVYLETLGRAVRDHCAVAKESEQNVLAKVAKEWDALTDEIGRQRQIKAYQRHLGLISYQPESR